MSRTNSYCSWWKRIVHLTQKGDDLIQFSTGSYTQPCTQHLHLEAEWTLQTHPKLNFQSLCHPTSLPLSTNLLPLHLSPTQFLATHSSRASNQKPFFFFFPGNIFDAFHFLQLLCWEILLNSLFKIYSDSLLLFTFTTIVLIQASTISYLNYKKKKKKKTFHSYIFKKEYNWLTMLC